MTEMGSTGIVTDIFESERDSAGIVSISTVDEIYPEPKRIQNLERLVFCVALFFLFIILKLGLDRYEVLEGSLLKLIPLLGILIFGIYSVVYLFVISVIIGAAFSDALDSFYVKNRKYIDPFVVYSTVIIFSYGVIKIFELDQTRILELLLVGLLLKFIGWRKKDKKKKSEA